MGGELSHPSRLASLEGNGIRSRVDSNVCDLRSLYGSPTKRCSHERDESVTRAMARTAIRLPGNRRTRPLALPADRTLAGRLDEAAAAALAEEGGGAGVVRPVADDVTGAAAGPLRCRCHPYHLRIGITHVGPLPEIEGTTLFLLYFFGTLRVLESPHTACHLDLDILPNAKPRPEQMG